MAGQDMAAADVAGAEARPRMADPTLYLFDGYNLLHAGRVRRRPRARRSARRLRRRPRRARRRRLRRRRRGRELGPLSVRYAPNADTLLERLAAEHRDRERVCLVSSDSAVRGTSGQEVRKLSVARVPRRPRARRAPASPRPSGSASDSTSETRARLERLRRGASDEALACCKVANALVTRAGPCYLSAST